MELECSVCKKNKISSILKKEEMDMVKMDNEPWSNGTVIRHRVGYGSKLDEDIIYLAICDTCIEDRSFKIIKGM